MVVREGGWGKGAVSVGGGPWGEPARKVGTGHGRRGMELLAGRRNGSEVDCGGIARAVGTA